MIFIILFTFLSGLVSAVTIKYKLKEENQNILRSLLNLIVVFNIVWYTALLIEYSKSVTYFSKNPEIELLKDIFLFSVLFVIRILFLVTFFKLIDKILNLKFFKRFSTALKITAIVIISVWILAWAEVPISRSSNIVNTLLTYTDIIIYLAIIAACIYLFSRTKSIIDIKTQKAIKILTVFLFVPLLTAHLKWLLTTSIGNMSEFWEGLILHSMIFIINTLVLLWVIIYGKNIKTPVMMNIETKLDINELILK